VVLLYVKPCCILRIVSVSKTPLIILPVATTKCKEWPRSEVCKLWPVSKIGSQSHFIWLTKPFHLAHKAISSGSQSHFIWLMKPFHLAHKAISSGSWSHFIWLTKPFHLAHEAISTSSKDMSHSCVNNEKISKTLLIWWNVTYPETITMCEMSGPRTGV